VALKVCWKEVLGGPEGQLGVQVGGRGATGENGDWLSGAIVGEGFIHLVTQVGMGRGRQPYHSGVSLNL